MRGYLPFCNTEDDFKAEFYAENEPSLKNQP